MYARHATLTANTVSTFTATDNSSAFEVMNRNGAGEIYVSHDGTATPADPTVAGNDFDVVQSAIGAAIIVRRTGSAAFVVKVISAAATTVSIRGVQ
jgi:hypothetical protein